MTEIILCWYSHSVTFFVVIKKMISVCEMTQNDKLMPCCNKSGWLSSVASSRSPWIYPELRLLSLQCFICLCGFVGFPVLSKNMQVGRISVTNKNTESNLSYEEGNIWRPGKKSYIYKHQNIQLEGQRDKCILLFLSSVTVFPSVFFHESDPLEMNH